MRVTCLIFFSIFLHYGTIFSQNFTIEGKVINAQSEEPIPAATLILYQQANHQYVQGTTTDDNGHFKMINLPRDAYQLEVQYLGFQSCQMSFLLESNHNLGPIKLVEQATELTTVEVKGLAPKMNFEPGKTTLVVGQNALTEGGTALDALKLFPSVSLTSEGSLSIRGNQAIQILVDGQPSAQASVQGNRFLEQLDASSIAKIEVITNPSAKYSVSGSAGLINIIRKKQQGQGWQGQLKGSFDQKGATAWNMQSRFAKKQWAGFWNYQIRRRVKKRWNEEKRTTFLNDTTFFLQTSGKGHFEDWRHSLETGVEYYFAPKTYCTLAAQYFKRVKDARNYKNGQLWNDAAPLKIAQVNETQEPERNEGGGVEWRFFKEKTKHQKWEVLLSYIHSLEAEGVDRKTKWFGTDTILHKQVQTSYRDLNDRLIFTTGLEQGFRQTGNFQFGLSYIFRNIGQTFSVSASEGFLPEASNPGVANRFDYQDHVAGLFLVFTNQGKRLEYEFGLRLEQTINKYQSDQAGEKFAQNYQSFFPSAQLKYSIGDQQQLHFSYGKRIDRPSPNRLNPFPDYSDPNRLQIGNPTLQPVIIHRAELGHHWINEDWGITTTVFYDFYKNAIQRLLFTQENGAILRMPVNLNYRENYGGEITFKVSGIDWWSGSISCAAFRQAIGTDDRLRQAGITFQIKQQSDFPLSNRVKGQMLIQYQGPETQPQGYAAGQFTSDLAIQYKMKHPQISMTLKVQDLLLTQRENYHLSTIFMEEEQKEASDSRRIQLVLGYKF